MKRFLSMALVLIMALSLISAVMVSAEETVGTPGKVIVFSKNFEDSNISGTGFNKVAEETDGNHYASFTNFNAATMVKTGKASVSATGNYRLGA